MDHAISNQSFGLRENLAILFRNKRKIMAVFLSTVFISFIGSFLVSKVYEANARVLIQNYREASVISTSSMPSSTQILNSSKEKLLSEIEIFKSASVVGKVVDQFGTDSVLKKMQWRWDWVGAMPGKLRSAVTEALWSFPVTRMIFEALDIKKPIKKKSRLDAIKKISKHLAVEPITGTNVFVVSFESPNAEYSALMVNALIKSYQEYHLFLRQGISGNQLFSEEVNRLKNELRIAKKALVDLKHSSGIISVKPQIQLLIEKINKNQADIERTKLASMEAELRIKEIQRQLKRQPKVIRLENSRTRNPTLNTLTNQLTKLQIEKNLYVDNSTSANRLGDEIAAVKQRIENQKGSVRGLERSGINLVYQDLQKDLGLEKKKLQGLKNTYQELSKQKQKDEQQLELFDNEKMLIHEMELDIGVKEQALKLFSKKHEEERINSMLNNKNVSDVAPIELAVVPDSPASPSKIKNLIVGILVGLAGGVLVAYISEYFRRTLSTKEEVEEILNYPCFAAFRLLDGDNDIEAEAYNSSQLRHLDQAVKQLKSMQQIKSIFIGSALKGEGKSKVARMLAHSLASRNTRVLLVENLFLDQAQPVYSNVQESKEITIKFEALAEPENPDLHHIKRAALSTTEERKPSMGEFMKLIEPVQEKYEFIIVDGPAQSAVPESISLASQMDSVLLIVEADKTSSINISKTISTLKNAGAPVHGMVLNKRSFTIPEWVYNWFLLTAKPT